MLIGAGAELDALGRLDQRGDEHHARGDVLGAVGGVLADVALDEAELVGEDERLAVLAQRRPPVLAQRMDRHGEEAEFHAPKFAPQSPALPPPLSHLCRKNVAGARRRRTARHPKAPRRSVSREGWNTNRPGRRPARSYYRGWPLGAGLFGLRPG